MHILKPVLYSKARLEPKQYDHRTYAVFKKPLHYPVE